MPIFLLYSLSAFGAALVSVLRPLPPHPSGDGLLRALRAGAVGGLFLLAFGTGCANARTVAAAQPVGVYFGKAGATVFFDRAQTAVPTGLKLENDNGAVARMLKLKSEIKLSTKLNLIID